MTRKQAFKYYDNFCSSISHLDSYEVSFCKNSVGDYYIRVFSYNGVFCSPLINYVFKFSSQVLKSSYNVIFNSKINCIKIEL